VARRLIWGARTGIRIRLQTKKSVMTVSYWVLA
jgi:hypothetical protein